MSTHTYACIDTHTHTHAWTHTHMNTAPIHIRTHTVFGKKKKKNTLPNENIKENSKEENYLESHFFKS